MKAKETHSIAMVVSRICNTIATVAGQFPITPPIALIRQDMEKERAQLQLNFGNSDEVIVGVNMLSQREKLNKNEFVNDIQILQDTLKRKGLSRDAKETLARGIRDIENKLKHREIALKKRV